MVQMSSQAVSSSGAGSQIAPDSPTSTGSPDSRSKPKKRPEKLNLNTVTLEVGEQGLGDTFVDKDEIDPADHVHMYSVPNKKSDFAFFKDTGNVATPKRSQNDNLTVGSRDSFGQKLFNIFKKKKDKGNGNLGEYDDFNGERPGPTQTPRSAGTVSQKEFRSADEPIFDEPTEVKKGQLLSEVHDEFELESRNKPKPKVGNVFGIQTGSDKKGGTEQNNGPKEPPKSVPKEMTFKSNPFSFTGPEVDLLGKDSPTQPTVTQLLAGGPTISLLGDLAPQSQPTIVMRKASEHSGTDSQNAVQSATQKPKATEAQVSVVKTSLDDVANIDKLFSSLKQEKEVQENLKRTFF